MSVIQNNQPQMIRAGRAFSQSARLWNFQNSRLSFVELRKCLLTSRLGYLEIVQTSIVAHTSCENWSSKNMYASVENILLIAMCMRVSITLGIRNYTFIYNDPNVMCTIWTRTLNGKC